MYLSVSLFRCRIRNVRHSAAARTLLGLMSLFAVMEGVAAAGTWTRVTRTNPQFANGIMMLLTDGTVMVESGNDNQTWTKLAPDSTGSYVNGTWTTLARMSTPRLYFGSNVLPDGRVFVLGGEYSGPFLNQNFSNTGEIYNPVTNKWTAIAKFPMAQFGDDPTVLLPDGTIMAGHLSSAQTFVYYPQYDFWFNGATKLRNDQSDEETWIMLPGYQVLSYDVFSSVTLNQGHAQKYDYFSDQWLDAGNVPVILSTATQGFELGPGAMLPNGKVIQIGANENTAIYTPPANSTQPGTWAAGPTLPAGMGADDAPGAMLPDGHFLFLADSYLFNSPTLLFDYDYTTNTLTDITATLPAQLRNELANGSAYTCRMLVLPNGAMLMTTGSSTLWEFMPSGTSQATWKPTISTVTKTGTHTFRLTGARLTGISEGASYGDDAEMSTNYPIVKLVRSGVVSYAKTTNWTPGISKPGDTSLQTVNFDTPAGLAPGTYDVSVIANGISSASVPVLIQPANVTASFASGTLTVTGDADPSNITLTYKQTKVSGVFTGATVTITPSDAYTTINGSSSAVFNVGTARINVNADMGAGDDVITLNSLFAATINLKLGDGNDTATFLYNSIYTLLSVDGGTGTDVVTYTGNSIIKQTTVNVP
jgi:hypothetical protein